jgi:Na+/H+ antiporter NhaD/arsenite permease-like protein
MRVFGIPFEFVLFGLTLAGVAIFHHRNFEVAVTGLLSIVVYKLVATDLDLPSHLHHEWRLLLNLFGLLLGFAILARHFEDSWAPEWFMRKLPGGRLGGFLLLVGVAVMSTFVDNIAAAILGGVIAKKLYKGKVGVGYLAAIVAAANAGGAGSPIGDTTTTMMWISGVPPWELARAFIAVAGVVAFVGFFAARAQHRLQPIRDLPEGLAIDAGHLAVVVMIIAGAIGANVLIELPGVGVWVGILAGGLIRAIPWNEVPKAIKGTIFLLCLVLSASLMPVSSLPSPSWHTAFGLGAVSAVFDNIPLTALAIFQGKWDWGMLAYTVGFGGSMIWFGSSAGVGICNRFPEAKHTGRWLREGWHVAVAYVLGFGIFLAVDGWKPYDVEVHRATPIVSPAVGGAVAAGVFFFAVLVGLRHWAIATHPLAGPLHVPQVHVPHVRMGRPHLPSRRKPAHDTTPTAAVERPRRRAAPGRHHSTL